VSALPVLRGHRVLLRPPRESDREDRLAGGRDLEFWRMVGGFGAEPGPLTQAELDRWYAKVVAEPYEWVVDLDGHCVGTARLHDHDRDAGSAWYAVGLFWPAHRGRGFGQEVTHLVLDYAFGSLGLQSVKVRVLDFNARAIACYRRCGFIEQSREPVQLSETSAVDVIMEARAAREPPVGQHGQALGGNEP
jgi:ribosomal-protein-alanine N-acetyltransferase